MPRGSALGMVTQLPDKVGRCRLTVSNPVLKAPTVSALEIQRDGLLSTVCFQIKLVPLQQGRDQHHPQAAVGRAVQVDPIKPILKPPGTKRLKLEYDGLLSNFAFNSNLRRYMLARLDVCMGGRVAEAGPGPFNPKP